MAGYNEALRRLSAYGEQMNLSKTELAQSLGLLQNNYHEHEIGKRMISVDHLKTFKKNGGDLYYLVTGREYKPGPVEEIFAQCETKEQKELMLNLLISNMEYAAWLEGGQTKEIFVQLHKAIRLFDDALSQYSLWYRIRKVEYLNQEQFSNNLGIEERQYRKIEKGGTAAWAVLCELESKYHYSPLQFLDVDQYFIDELNHCWNKLSKKGQRYVAHAIGYALESKK